MNETAERKYFAKKSGCLKIELQGKENEII